MMSILEPAKTSTY